MSAAFRLAVLTLLLGLIGVPVAGAVEVFQQDFTAQYVLKARGLVVGRSAWSLTAGDAELVYEVETNAAGIAVFFSNDHIIERSVWRRHGEVLKPHEYRYDRSGGRKEKRVAVDFLWSERMARNTSHGRTWKMPIPGNAIDKMSYVIAMMHGLGNGQQSFEYSVADGGKLKLYTLTTVGDESLDTKIGTLKTIKVLRRRDDSTRETTFWCAPELGFLPVKVEHREPDGETVTGYVEAVSGFTANTTADPLSGLAAAPAPPAKLRRATAHSDAVSDSH